MTKGKDSKIRKYVYKPVLMHTFAGNGPSLPGCWHEAQAKSGQGDEFAPARDGT